MLGPTLIVTASISRTVSWDVERRVRAAAAAARDSIDQYKAEGVEYANTYLRTEGAAERISETLSRPRVFSPPGAEPVIIWLPGLGQQPNVTYAAYSAGTDGGWSPIPTVMRLDIGGLKTLLAGAITPLQVGEQTGALVTGRALSTSFMRNVKAAAPLDVRIYRLPEEQSLLGLPDDAAKRVLEEHQTAFRREVVVDGQEYVAMYLPLVGHSGGLLGVAFFGLPTEYTFASVISGRRYYPYMIATGVLFGIVMGYMMAKGISRPVRSFSRGALAVARGQLDQTFEYNRRDELGDLSRAFNRMMRQLRRLHDIEEELRRKDRLAALGELSAGVAHEIRNPLGIIRNSAQMLGERSQHEQEKELSVFIVEEVDRLNAVVQSFLDFARPQQPRLEPTEIGGVVDRALRVSEPMLQQNGIEVDWKGAGDLPKAMADADQLGQALSNLFRNAAEAMEDGGRLTVRASLSGRPRFGDPEEVRQCLEITVSDTGPGIPEEQTQRIFNPFFSTKDTGTGLGLAIVHRIVVDNHGGALALTSKPGEGTTFTVQLPLVDTEEEGQETDASENTGS